MNARRWITGTLILVAASACQRAAPQLETRTFGLEHLDGGTAEVLLWPYVYDDREVNPGMMTASDRAVTVRETEDNLERIARVLEELDQAPPEIRLHFQVIEANGAGEPDPAIAHVEAELRRIFRFEGYRLVGEAVLAPTGGGRFSATLVGHDDDSGDWRITGGRFPDQPRAYGEAAPEPGSSGGRRGIRLDGVTLWTDESGVVLETSVNVRPGQTLVLGSARSPDGRSGAVILTVRAEVVDP